MFVILFIKGTKMRKVGSEKYNLMSKAVDMYADRYFIVYNTISRLVFPRVFEYIRVYCIRITFLRAEIRCQFYEFN